MDDAAVPPAPARVRDEAGDQGPEKKQRVEGTSDSSGEAPSGADASAPAVAAAPEAGGAAAAGGAGGTGTGVEVRPACPPAFCTPSRAPPFKHLWNSIVCAQNASSSTAGDGSGANTGAPAAAAEGDSATAGDGGAAGGGAPGGSAEGSAAGSAMAPPPAAGAAAAQQPQAGAAAGDGAAANSEAAADSNAPAGGPAARIAAAAVASGVKTEAGASVSAATKNHLPHTVKCALVGAGKQRGEWQCRRRGRGRRPQVEYRRPGNVPVG